VIILPVIVEPVITSKKNLWPNPTPPCLLMPLDLPSPYSSSQNSFWRLGLAPVHSLWSPPLCHPGWNPSPPVVPHLRRKKNAGAMAPSEAWNHHPLPLSLKLSSLSLLSDWIRQQGKATTILSFIMLLRKWLTMLISIVKYVSFIKTPCSL